MRMSDIAIRVEGLGKQYLLGESQENYSLLSDRLMDAMKNPLKILSRLNGRARKEQDILWALKDISFTVKQGDVIGIIGRNGAGKSTLLKILSRIIEPSEGFAEIRGRVGSLLEVGTGFHQELTGRENIFLNGAILGMKRTEIERKFEEIVDFAEVRRFIDTPVKHYSSGMYLRLAFGVAAHLEPEVLIVDEVLAVGDAQFQRKCLGKMGDVAEHGRTILFVSHNMEAVMTLCKRGIVLQQGKIAFEGNAHDAVQFYHRGSFDRASAESSHVIQTGAVNGATNSTCITRIEILDAEGNPKPSTFTWDDLLFRVYYTSTEDYRCGTVILDVIDYKNQRLIVLDSGVQLPLRKGEHYIECFVPKLALSAGEYYIGAGLTVSNSSWLWRNTNIGTLIVHGRDIYDIGRPPAYDRMIFAVSHEWREP
jgi:lipopolysaccharide transport system ATP-binding protein